jgi:hypothetical protein
MVVESTPPTINIATRVIAPRLFANAVLSALSTTSVSWPKLGGRVGRVRQHSGANSGSSPLRFTFSSSLPHLGRPFSFFLSLHLLSRFVLELACLPAAGLEHIPWPMAS